MLTDTNATTNFATTACNGNVVAEESKTPFWNVNVPPDQHTQDCPDYLEYALHNDKDRGILSTPDEQHQQQSWQVVTTLIHNNRLDLFQRLPSDLRTYRQYCHRLTQTHGSVMEFVVQDRLRWTDLQASGPPFNKPEDLQILCNDWPYGLDPRIVHLVVWTKFDLPVDPHSDFGDMAPETRRMIGDYVDRTFVSVCGPSNVLWFKNWRSLKSIDAVEHFHVMLFDPDPEFVSEITHGDVPLAQKIKAGDQNGTAAMLDAH